MSKWTAVRRSRSTLRTSTLDELGRRACLGRGRSGISAPLIMRQIYCARSLSPSNLQRLRQSVDRLVATGAPFSRTEEELRRPIADLRKDRPEE